MIELAGTLAAALGVGFLSALVPVVNAEAYVLALAAAASPALGWASVAGVAVGQTAGKQLMFQAARSGGAWSRRLTRRSRRAPGQRTPGTVPDGAGRVRRKLVGWGERGLHLLDRPWPAAGVVLAAASVGVPPLAVVSVAAGLRTTPPVLVAACTLGGRLARFAVMAAPLIWATS